MFKLTTAMVVGAVLVATSVGDAQAAKIKFPFLDFGTIADIGSPDVILDPNKKPPIKIDKKDDGSEDDGGIVDPDKKDPIEIGEKPDGAPWTFEHGEPDQGDWHQTTGSPDEDEYEDSSDTPDWFVETGKP